MRWLHPRLAAAIAALLWLAMCPSAYAGPGGDISGPGLCDYPGVGGSARVNVIGFGEGYYCDFPREENGSVWRCIAGYGGLSGAFGFELNGNGASGIALGGGGGACNFVCPESPMPGLVTFQPNPPGLWKQFLKPTKCVPLDPPHFLVEPAPVPGPDPNDTNPAAQLAPPLGLLSPVTNPGTPNPDATENPGS
jgi:hypothetical protein